MTLEDRANLMWSIHPKKLQDAKKTRLEFYVEQLKAAENEAYERAAKLIETGVVSAGGSYVDRRHEIVAAAIRALKE